MTPSLLLNPNGKLSENPLWDAREACLYWTDIEGGVMHRFDPATREHERIYKGPSVGGFTLQEDGGLLLFRVDDIALLHPSHRVEVLWSFEDAGTKRFNDVIADPEGRVFAGTIGQTDGSGGVWRLERDGALHQLWRGTKIANGMDFSPDLRHFYWTDSTYKTIFRFDYDRTTGRLTNRAPLTEVEDGTPDGLTVDAEGNLWSARYGGGAVVEHAPDGTVLTRVSLPVENVTAPTFMGPDLKGLVVTTAEGDTSEGGALFVVPVKVGGREPYRSRVGL